MAIASVPRALMIGKTSGKALTIGFQTTLRLSHNRWPHRREGSDIRELIIGYGNDGEITMKSIPWLLLSLCVLSRGLSLPHRIEKAWTSYEQHAARC